MKVYDFDDYRAYMRGRVESLPGKGRGEYSRIAEAIRTQPSVLSQVMSSQRDLTAEMAAALCEYYGFGELETDYFLTLVQFGSAGNTSLKKVLKRQLEALRARGGQVVNRMPKKRVLSEKDQAVFYSQWFFSAIRLLTAVEDLQTPDAIAKHLGLSRGTVASALEFLLSSGLCIEEKGKLRIGPQILHLPGDSPFASRMHVNWRLKAMERFDRLEREELAFSSAVVISRDDAAKIRLMALQFVDQWGSAVDRSGSEELYCLNLDWVKVV